MISQLILIFLKIGFLGFGGGYAMLSLIFSESHTLGITLHQFADLNALDVLMPGPIAINSATYVGQIVSRISGGIIASLAVMVPSFIFIPLYLHYEERLLSNAYLQGALAGMKNASVGLILSVAILLGKDTLFPNQNLAINWFAVGIILVCLYLNIKKEINPLVLTLAAGVVGYISYYL